MQKTIIQKILVLMLAFSPMILAAQPSTFNEVHSNHSINPIRKADIMYRKAIWFRLDLRTKINEPLYARGNEISKILIEAVRSGKVSPYMNDSLETKMDLEEFDRRLRIPQADREELMVNLDESWNDGDWGDEAVEAAKVPEQDEYFPRQLYVLELREDRIFDKKRSRMFTDTQAITIIIPAEQTPTGIDKVLASFSFKELVDNVFSKNDALWYNPTNSAEHRTLTEAFTMRLFRGQLVKFENPKDNRIVDIFGQGKAGLAASERALHELLEYESTLWSY